MAKAKYTINDMQEIAKKNGGKCLSTEYVSIHDHLQWECKKGHQWWAEPNTVLNAGGWCKVCYHESMKLGIEAMQLIAKSHGGKCLSKSYGKNQKDPLEWQCKNGHTFFQTPKNVKHSNSWCKECKKKQ